MLSATSILFTGPTTGLFPSETARNWQALLRNGSHLYALKVEGIRTFLHFRSTILLSEIFYLCDDTSAYPDTPRCYCLCAVLHNVHFVPGKISFPREETSG